MMLVQIKCYIETLHMQIIYLFIYLNSVQVSINIYPRPSLTDLKYI